MSRKQSKSKLGFIVIAILVIALAVVVTLFMSKETHAPSQETTIGTDESQEVPQEQKQVQIYSGTDRPIAVMIDNNVNARPQAGINKAYMVYEIIVEGGETRLMALFKNINVEKIGPVRSSRHYFLDYALENDAIYAHFGWSTFAEADISKYGVNNINGLYEDGTTYLRDKSRSAPHNAVTSTDKLLASANKKGYRTTSDQRSVLKYTTDEVLLEEGQTATDVKIPYSSYNTVEYKYNEETKRYTRYSKGQKQTDWSTGEDITTKNIIITFAENYTLPNGGVYGCQDLKNVGTLDGYYITNGKAIKIKCEKSARTSKTVYKDLNGNEIDVNDGNTFVQICPINAKVTLISE